MTNNNSTNEIWMPVKNFPGYEVSNLGRVRTWKKRNGKSLRTEPVLKSSRLDANGYYKVDLIQDGNRKTMWVHRLVAEAFLGSIHDGMHVCHNNGIPSDNRLENLRIDTPKANSADRVKHGTASVPRPRKLTAIDAMQARLALDVGTLSQREIADALGVHRTTIKDLWNGKTWKHVAVPF